jgi:hypothetical protein
MMVRVLRFHKTNTEVLDFLVQELRDTRANGWTRASVGSIWHYARWVLTRKYRAPGESYVMSNNLFPHYARIIAILHPDLNGFFTMTKSAADKDFGTMLEPVKNQKPGYIRRLVRADGREIDFRPTTPHEPKPVHRKERVRRKPQGSVRPRTDERETK